MKKIILACGFAGLLLSCEAATTAGNSQVGKAQASIANSKWELSDVVKGKTPTLNIEDNRITGNAGCNNYFGEVALNPESGTFKADKVGSTRMACDNLSVEQNFLNAINSTNRYVVSGNTLELYKDNLLLLKLNRKP